MKNPIKRIKAWISARIAKAVRRELAVIFRKQGEVCVDAHLRQDSWAVIKVDVDDICYLKFINLGKRELREIQRFMKQFERSRVDADPQAMRIMNGFRGKAGLEEGIDFRWFE